jgi:hypothetical protein
MLPDDDTEQGNDGVIVSKEQAGMNSPTCIGRVFVERRMSDKPKSLS